MKKIVFADGDDPRVQQATAQLAQAGMCTPILLKKPDGEAPQLGIEMIDPDSIPVEPDLDVASLDPELVAGASLVAQGIADGMVAGAVNTTAEVFRVYLKVIGLAPGVSRASSCFLMERETERYLFADCAITIEPDATTLAQIAYAAHTFAGVCGIESRVAFLSFATGASAQHASVDVVRAAVAETKDRWPEIICDGPLQVDSALVPVVQQRKAPDSVLEGAATVFIFPDINSGNIGYKLAERLGGFTATGPLLLGFAKPVHDLSRGCSVDDIVAAAKIAILQAS